MPMLKLASAVKIPLNKEEKDDIWEDNEVK